jgi:hypothetical protein
MKQKGDYMSEFQKGLLLGIMIMSSMFLFTAQTRYKMGKNEKKEISHYVFINETKWGAPNIRKFLNEQGYQPYGSPFIDDKVIEPSYVQAMVKYK